MVSFQIHVLYGNQSVPEHVHPGLALFKNDVADQRLVDSIFRFHFDEENFIEDRAETFDLNANGSANLTRDRLLRCGFEFDGFDGFQFAEPIFPRAWQHHERRTCIYKRIAPKSLRRVGDVCDGDGGDDSSHDLISPAQ